MPERWLQLEAAYRGVLDRYVLKELDEAWECSSQDHWDAHTHGGLATHVVEGRCECMSGFRCGTYVKLLRAFIAAHRASGTVAAGCPTCLTETSFSELKILPLEKES